MHYLLIYKLDGPKFFNWVDINDKNAKLPKDEPFGAL
jgi:hypothetical protein